MGTLVFICLIVYLVYSTNKKKKKVKMPNEKHLPLTQRKYIDLSELTFNSESYLDIFNRLKQIYYNGDVLTTEQYNAYEAEINALERDDFAQDLLHSLTYALSERDVQIGLPTSKILLKPRESVYFQSSNTIVDKVKAILRNISFCGFRYNKGAFRSGNMYVRNTEVNGISRFGAGRFFVTNQRIVFTGVNKNNFSIPLGNILSYAAYENDGVIFTIANGKPIIVSFPYDEKFHNTKTEFGILFNDDKTQLLYALDKVFELRSARQSA